MASPSRLSVARHVLKGGALVGDLVPLKLVLEEALFEEFLAQGRVAVGLCTKDGSDVCPRVELEGSESTRVLHFDTSGAKRVDVAVRFVLCEGGEPVLYSQPWTLGRAPTEEELALALADLEKDRASASASASSSPRDEDKAPREGGSQGSSPRGGWVAVRSPTLGVASVFSNPSSPRSPRGPLTSPRVRSCSSATAEIVSTSRPMSGPITMTPKSPRSILRVRKSALSFQIGQTVLALCQMDDEWRKCTIRGLSDVSACVWFDDIALEQEDTPMEHLQILKPVAASGRAGSVSRGSDGGSSDFGSCSVEEDVGNVLESLRESPRSKGIGFARVTRDFVALRDGQVSVRKGALVDVIELVNKDWVLCEVGDERGRIPANALNNPS